MEFLGIGPLELLFILIIALIVLGPSDMVKAGRTLGRLMRSIVTSPTWRTLQDASREMRNLPNRLMREAGIEDLQKDLPDPRKLNQDLGINQINNELNGLKQDLSLSAWTTPPSNSSLEAEQTSVVESDNSSKIESEEISEPLIIESPEPPTDSSPISEYTTPSKVESEEISEPPIFEAPEPSTDSSPISESTTPSKKSEL